jgi:hypothetical protein
MYDTEHRRMDSQMEDLILKSKADSEGPRDFVGSAVQNQFSTGKKQAFPVHIYTPSKDLKSVLTGFYLTSRWVAKTHPTP